VVNWQAFISQCFNGLVLGALLALISSGLTIIYGTLGVLNLAHGAMFMLAATLAGLPTPIPGRLSWLLSLVRSS
jgi:branched-chain amino acid transport system permease protein